MNPLAILRFCMLGALYHSVSHAEGLRPEEAKAFHQIVTSNGREIEAAPAPGVASYEKLLKGFEVEFKGPLGAVALIIKGKPNQFFSVIHDAEGYALVISFNGPWLDNEGLRVLKVMERLKIIGGDHNGVLPPDDIYDGTGFDALADSGLLSIRLTLGMSDKGMEQVAKIQSLRNFHAFHSRVTQAGVAFFENHPNIESFSIGEMAIPAVTGKVFASMATMPKITTVGLLESYADYETGFVHLAPLKGKLKTILLSGTVVLEADLERLRADHPDAEIKTTPLAEIAKNAFVRSRLMSWMPEEAKKQLADAVEP